MGIKRHQEEDRQPGHKATQAETPVQAGAQAEWPAALTARGGRTPHQVIALQRAVGNRAVQRLLRRDSQAGVVQRHASAEDLARAQQQYRNLRTVYGDARAITAGLGPALNVMEHLVLEVRSSGGETEGESPAGAVQRHVSDAERQLAERRFSEFRQAQEPIRSAVEGLRPLLGGILYLTEHTGVHSAASEEESTPGSGGGR
jgi:hypothetical protein